MTDGLREIKSLMACIGSRLANDDVFTMRRTMDELVLAMNLLIGLIEDSPAAAPDRSPRPPAAGPNLFDDCCGACWDGEQ